MIRHTILFKLKAHVTPIEIEHIFSNILDLAGMVPGILSITGGTCHFHEHHKSFSFSHGFSIDFEDSFAMNEFIHNPLVSPIKDQIIAMTEGGSEGVLGFDFGISKDPKSLM